MKPRFAQVLQDLRIKRGLTQVELAERARLSVNAISLLERGERRAPRRQTIAALAAALELDADERLALESAVRVKTAMAADDVRAVPRSNLPSHATSFMGRRAEMAAIRRRLVRSQLVTIVGAGGIGKTRIALEVASLTSGLYSGGAVCLDLTPFDDVKVVIAQLSATLGVPHGGRGSAIDRLLEHIVRLHLLIVLDNCEHLVGEIALLASRILQAAPRVRILATSRERLRIAGETAFALPTLRLPDSAISFADVQAYDSIALFIERASLPGSNFVFTGENAPLVVAICRRLEGVALAIELVAARAAFLGLPGLMALLDDRLSTADAGGAQADIPWMLSATIAWSYGLLDHSERALFRRLARFSNGWSIRGAEAVCAGDDLPIQAIPDVLISLTEKSLVITEEYSDSMRYRFLESTRIFAHDRLLEAGESEEIARRHAFWVGELADLSAVAEWTMSRNAWHAKYRPDLEDAGLAADWSLGDGHEPVLAIRILAGFRGIWLYMGLGAEIAFRAEAALQQIDPNDAEHVALLYLVFNAIVGPSHDLNTAFADFANRAKEALERVGDFTGLGALHGNLAYQLAVLGEFGRAQAESKTALAYYRVAGAERSRRCLPYLIHYGLLALELDDPKTAGETLRDAVALARSLNDDYALDEALSATAVAAFAAGDVRRALRMTQENLARGRALASDSEAIRLTDLAAYRVAVGDKRGSLHSAGVAIDKTRDRFPYAFFTALHHLAAALALNGRLVEAARTVGHLQMIGRLRGFGATLLERHSLREYVRMIQAGLAPERIVAEERIGAALNQAELLEQVMPEKNS